jgi:polyisoprenoid-binding protein YceI
VRGLAALPGSMSRMSKTVKLVLAGALVLAVLVGAGLWYFFRDDAPSAVSADDARETAEAAAEEREASGEASTEDGIEGTWAVDTSIGTFDYSQTASATFVGFRIAEELQGVGSTEAVGRTPTVTGEITIEGTTASEATIEADMTDITTDRSQRNSRVQGALGTGEFPTATFVLTEPIDFGGAADTGEQVQVTATGDLTIHGVTQSVELPLTVFLVGDIITVTGSLEVTFADYGVSVPSAPVVLAASDTGTIEIQLFLTRA